MITFTLSPLDDHLVIDVGDLQATPPVRVVMASKGEVHTTTTEQAVTSRVIDDKGDPLAVDVATDAGKTRSATVDGVVTIEIDELAYGVLEVETTRPKIAPTRLQVTR